MTGIPHDTARPALEVTDLRVVLGGNLALDGVGFALRGGDSVAVVGPNGAGKSTLFRAIAGIIERESGKIEVYGSEPDSTPALPTCRRRTAWMGPFPSPCLTW